MRWGWCSAPNLQPLGTKCPSISIELRAIGDAEMAPKVQVVRTWCQKTVAKRTREPQQPRGSSKKQAGMLFGDTEGIYKIKWRWRSLRGKGDDFFWAKGCDKRGDKGSVNKPSAFGSLVSTPETSSSSENVLAWRFWGVVWLFLLKEWGTEGRKGLDVDLGEFVCGSPMIFSLPFFGPLFFCSLASNFFCMLRLRRRGGAGLANEDWVVKSGSSGCVRPIANSRA